MPEPTPPAAPSPPATCPQCGTGLAAYLLSCPGCGALIYAGELKRLADEATRAGQPLDALTAWRRAHALLPPGSRQRAVIEEKIDSLVKVVESSPRRVSTPTAKAPDGRTQWARILCGLAVAGMFLFKFKFVFFLLGKGKLLLLGLTKMSTLLSMFVSFGAYWVAFGWQFGAGLVLSIYIHEMGHVAMLHRLGIRATAPMFIPGFGAFIRLREHLPTAREEALVGLAGPIWGLGAAVAAFALSHALHSPMLGAIAHMGAIINLFNLTPVWQLDGAHAFRALTRQQRWIVTATVGVAWLTSGVAILILVLVCAVWRSFEKEAAPVPNHRAFAEFLFLVATLSFLGAIHITP